MVVTVLPSPSGVGVMAVTSMYLPFGRSFSRSEDLEVDLRLVLAVQLDLVVFQAQLPRDLGDR